VITDVPLDTQRYWLRELAERWRRINYGRLDMALKIPQFELFSGVSNLGRWDALTRTIGMSIDHMAVASWAEIALTLSHEMAHQIVSEIFMADAAKPHGQLFAKACAMVQIPNSVRAERSDEHQKIRARIQKLMALSQSSNRHEAQAAMAAANRLLLKHNIDIRDNDVDSAYEWRFIGGGVGQISLERKLLGTVLSKHFFVECVWIRSARAIDGKRANMLEVFGTPENLDLAEYVHEYLLRTLDQLWKQFRQENPRRSGRAVRNEYRIGVLMGFLEHLDSQKESHAAEGLIWLGDPGVDELRAKRHPNLANLSGGRYRVGAAHNAGKAQGKGLRIRPGVQAPTKRGRRLT
jgi:hypothetical protein